MASTLKLWTSVISRLLLVKEDVSRQHCVGARARSWTSSANQRLGWAK